MFLPIRPIQERRNESTTVSTLAKSNLAKTDSIMLGLQSPWPNWDSVLDEAPQAPVILLVDEVELNRRLIKALLKTSGYEILESQKPSEALALLAERKIDLVIVDQVQQEMSGPEFCRLVKRERTTQLIPIMITSSVQGLENEVAGFESGADELLIKPLQPALVRTRVRSMLRNKALIDSLDEAEAILFALAQSVEHRDRYTGLHCERLAAYSIALAQALGLNRRDQLALYRGGYLHDIGKVAIPDSILFKRGLLNDEEWKTMRLHTIRGEEICKPMKTLAPVLPIIRSHHERWDGTGYPDGIKGENIPLLARILQVADIYDALTTSRPYKPAFTHDHAVQLMLEEAQRGWRDPELVTLFAEVAKKTREPQKPAWIGGTTMQESLEAMRMELSR
jgi:putative two-component system response regulator